MSNNHTNRIRKYNNEIRGADKYGRGSTKVGDVTEVRDDTGEVIDRLVRPRKRPLSEVILDQDLVNFLEAKRPRVPRARTPSGGPGSSGAGPSASAAPNAAAAVLPPISEEEYPLPNMEEQEQQEIAYPDYLLYTILYFDGLISHGSYEPAVCGSASIGSKDATRESGKGFTA